MRIPLPQSDLSITQDGYMAKVSTPYKKEFVEWIKQYPGREWDRTEKVWKVPLELWGEVSEGIQEFYKQEPDMHMHFSHPIGEIINEDLYEFQRVAVHKVLQEGGTGFLNFEMGLGKTPTAIEILKHLNCHTVLIVCPAVVRLNWESELKKWGWKGNIQILDTGKKAKSYAEEPVPGAVIVSYELLTHLTKCVFAATIFDESHYIKNNKAGRSKHARSIRIRNPSAACLCLSATPITSEPKDLHNQLDMLWPGRFGTFWQFVNRYSNLTSNGYGTEIKGTNDLHISELESRISATCQRVTKHEVAHLLPPFLVQTLRVKTKKRWNQRS